MDAKETAKILLDGNALNFNVKEPYTFASGIRSPVYMDCRLLISDVKGRGRIVDGMVDAVKTLKADSIAAAASAGIPWGAWVADRLSLPLLYVRQSAKDHGKGKKVEGKVVKGMTAVVVEDLVSTGGSSLATVESLREEGVKVEDCVSIFTYEFEEAKESFSKAGVRLHPLSNFPQAVDVALQKGKLTNEEADEAKKWNKDPKRWKI
ncbi:MAG: orotate phosphoribosyltransferase [Candidatus Altiarchaeota archaeon]